jgi:hypothetical protein
MNCNRALECPVSTGFDELTGQCSQAANSASCLIISLEQEGINTSTLGGNKKIPVFLLAKIEEIKARQVS